MARIRNYFAPPPAPLTPLPDHIALRESNRCLACTRLLEQLHQPDGTLKLAGIHIGKIARATKIKFKRIAQALKDLVTIGIVPAYEVPAHVVTTGNRCGHRPLRPRCFFPPSWHKRHSGVIVDAIERLRDYYDNPDLLPLLNAANRRKSKGKGAHKHHRHRSEGREACVALLGAILHYTDLLTLRVGRPQQDGSLAGIPMTELAELAGLAQLRADGSLCIRRAERAMEALVAAGIITVYPIAETLDEVVYWGRAAIRTVHYALFSRLGLGAKLSKAREHAAEKKKRQDNKRAAREFANIRMGIERATRKKRSAPDPDKQAAKQAEADSKRRMQTMFALMDIFPPETHKAEFEAACRLIKSHPDASAAEIAAMLPPTGPPS